MAKLTKKKKIAALTAAVVVVGASGAAYAYWTNSGSGNGTATTGTNAAVTVVQTSSVPAMYPGQSAQALSGNFNNPNAGNTYVTAVTATGYTIDATHVTAGCLVGDGHYTLGGHLQHSRRRSGRQRAGRLVGPDGPDEQPGHQPRLLQGRHSHHHLRQQLSLTHSPKGRTGTGILLVPIRPLERWRN